MTRESVQVTPELQQYLVDHTTPVDDVLDGLAKETTALGGISRMQIGPEQAALLTMLTRLVGAKSAVEVGTFTGYSSIAIARGLANGGRLLCCDVSEEWTAVARRYWERAGVADRIELRLAPALETLQALPQDATIDFAFVDADKEGYVSYWEELVPRMRQGGVIVADNVLFSGEVVALETAGASARAIHVFNEHVIADDRVDLVMLPVADGVTIARKR